MTTTTSRPATSTTPLAREGTETDRPWLWNVVLIDDDDHSYDYVINLSCKLFSHPVERAFKIAQAVDSQGRAVLLTTHKEHAELKLDQIRSFGRDRLISSCQGAMTAIIEPAEFQGDDENQGNPPA
jgi:ATP-dependent Clp protease adaptor protein ClpS